MAASTGYENVNWTGNVTVTDNKFTMPENDVTLTATASLKNYTITLDNEGKTSTINATYNTALPSIQVPTRTGYIFKGYFTSKNGEGTQYINDQGKSAKNWNIDANTTLYAYWVHPIGIVPEILYGDYTDGKHDITIKDVTYEVRVINIYDGKSGDDDGTVNGKITISSDKDYGDVSDVGTADADATRMVIVKYHGNVVINSGVTVTSVKSADGYGGPKGMYLCATGTLTNNGTISMTQRGAKAVGENVYLYSMDNTWTADEYVPATGASGGIASKVSKTYTTTTPGAYSNGIAGTAGSDGSGRSTGGGGSGAAGIKAYRNADTTKAKTFEATAGSGGAGTSYSGGTGGGAAGAYSSGTSSTKITITGNNGSSVGGSGGAYKSSGSTSANTNQSNGWYSARIHGGVGNKAGTSASAVSSDNGTGGLLIIYGKSIINSGTIESKGTSISTTLTYSLGGGSSGGGSVNIYHTNGYSGNEADVTGGEAVGTYMKGGAGGKGSKTVIKIG